MFAYSSTDTNKTLFSKSFFMCQVSSIRCQVSCFRLRQREKNLGNRVAVLPGKFLPSGKFFFFIYMIFFGTKSGILLDSKENLHLFRRSLQTIFASRQVSNKILEKFYLFWNISRQYGKVLFILEIFSTVSAPGQVSNKIPDKNYLFMNISRQYGKVSFFVEKFPDNIGLWTTFHQYFVQILFNMEHFQIVQKSFIYSGKFSGQYLFLDMFPDKFLDKICFRTKPRIFANSMEKISFTLEKFTEKNIFQIIFWTKTFGKICFWKKSGLILDSTEYIH